MSADLNFFHLSPEELKADHSGLTKVAIAFGIALPVVAVILRLLARRITGLKLGADDYMIIVAAFLTVGNSCVPIFANQGGNGRHMATLSKDELRKYFLSLFVFEQTFGVAVASVKISVLLLYRRIFVTRSFRISTTIIGVLLVIWVLVKNLVSAFQCRPIRKAWLKSTPGHCSVNFIHNVLAAQSFNVVFDLVILVLPINAVYRLKLPKYKKIGVMAIFAVGAFTCIVAILRLSIISSEVIKYGPKLPEITWFTAKFSWTVMDPAVGCFVACMPTWAPLAKPIQRIGEYASLLRITLTRSKNDSTRSRSKGTTKLEEQGAQDFYLSKYKQPGSREIDIGRESSRSMGSKTRLDPIPGTVRVKKEFTQDEYRRDIP